jgi:CRP-like cAMP-binding protein
MSRSTTTDPLGNVGIFSSCGPRELQRISRHGTTVAVGTGAVIQSAGTPLKWVYAVLDGSVAANVDGDESLVGGGGAIGVRSALAGERAPTEIVALTRTTLFVLGVREFLGLVTGLPGLGAGVARHLVRVANDT